MDKNNKFLCNMVSLNLLKEINFFLAIKVHNLIEAVKFSKNTDLIFISNVFRTNSHPERKRIRGKKFSKTMCIFKKKFKLCSRWNVKKKFS